MSDLVPRDAASGDVALRRIGVQTDVLGESPLWSAAEGALYWVDIRRPAIRRFRPAAGAVDTWAAPATVGAIGIVAGEHDGEHGVGRLVAAVGDGVALFDAATGGFETLCRLPDMPPGHRFNDGRCDPAGRFWISTMHNETRGPEGTLYRLDGSERGELALVPMLGGLRIPNSLCWSPDGATMYFADSLDHAIRAYPFDAASGRLGAARRFAASGPPGFPDGSTVDAEGCVWTAEFDAGRVVRRDPEGRILRTIVTPVPRPTACAFGGPDLDVLYVTTASQSMTAAERAAMPLAGALLACDVGVRGRPEALVRLPKTGTPGEPT